MRVPRYDNGITTAVWLTGIVESISAVEELKWEKERVHFGINEMPRRLTGLLGELREVVLVKDLNTQ